MLSSPEGGGEEVTEEVQGSEDVVPPLPPPPSAQEEAPTVAGPHCCPEGRCGPSGVRLPVFVSIWAPLPRAEWMDGKERGFLQPTNVHRAHALYQAQVGALGINREQGRPSVCPPSGGADRRVTCKRIM